MFGSYYHSLIIHAPQQYRLVSGRTESEEAIFNAIKVATNLTSNHHPPSTKQKINWTKTDWHLKKTKLKNMYNTIKQQFKNTIISFDWVERYQCLLKSQADYLTNKGKCWRELNFLIWMKVLPIVTCYLVTSDHQI